LDDSVEHVIREISPPKTSSYLVALRLSLTRSSLRVQAASKVSALMTSYHTGSIPPPRPSLTLALAVESSG
jgi:hypothetical protein